MTQATATPNTGKTLSQIATNAAIVAVRADDKAAYNATVAIAMVMANRQIERAETNEDITEKANKATFRMFMKVLANRGIMVWRDSQHSIDAIMALNGKAREKAASEYIDKKAKGARYVDGLARLRTWSFRLMKDVCVNHADVLRDMLVTKTAGAGGDALADKFREFVANTYGDSFAKLTDSLATDKPAKEAANPVDAIVKKAADMGDSDLALVIARLQGLWAERQQTAAELNEAMPPAETEAPAEQTQEAAAA